MLQQMSIDTWLAREVLQWRSRFIFHKKSFGFGREWGLSNYNIYSSRLQCTRTTARTTASIRRHANQENKKQNPKPRRQMQLFNVGVLILLVPLSECVSMFCVCAYMCVRMYCTVLMHGLPTCVRTHFSVIRYRPKPPGSRSCGGNDHSLSSNIFQIKFLSVMHFSNVEHWIHTHTHTHTHTYTRTP